MRNCGKCGERKDQTIDGDLFPGDPGTVTLVYAGKDELAVTGPSTGRWYKFGPNRRVVVMTAADAMALAVRYGLITAEVRIEDEKRTRKGVQAGAGGLPAGGDGVE